MNNALSCYTKILQSCKSLRCLHQIHSHLIIVFSPLTDSKILTLLINSYSSFHEPLSALSVFNSSQSNSTILFNSIIRCFTKTNEPGRSIGLFQQMLTNRVEPDNYSFTFILKACTLTRDLKLGKQVHGMIVRRGFVDDVFIGTALVDLYGKLGFDTTAFKVFDEMLELDIVTWNSMIHGFSQNGKAIRALELFREMKSIGREPNAVTFLNLFPAICEFSDVQLCEYIHCFVIKRNVIDAVLNGLIDAYFKCEDVYAACKVFDETVDMADDVTWATMISGYVFNGFFFEALETFNEIVRRDLKLNQVCVLSALSAAAEIGDLSKGIEIHNHAVQKRTEFDISSATMLMTMYAKCGDIEKAKSTFEKIEKKDTIAWSAIISAFVQTGHPNEALILLRDMQLSGFAPHRVTIVSVLPACGDLVNLQYGKSIHGYALRSGMYIDVLVGTALVSMYAQCELFAYANAVFNNIVHKEVITWNALINGYAQIGDAHNAVLLFRKLQITGIQPDQGTMVGVLPACSLLNAINLGRSVHALVIKNGFESDIHVKNSTIDMYAKCQHISSAEMLFLENKLHKDVISWNTMIAGYMYNGNAYEAMLTFTEMRSYDIRPNIVTLVSIIPAVAYMSHLRSGLALHATAIILGFESNLLVANSIIDMYAKCGRIGYAEHFFKAMHNRNTISWNAMISGYATNGLSERSVKLFKEMRDKGIKADNVSIVSVLSACRHGGLVEEGCIIFESMEAELDLEPRMEHYACMVDLLGRNGKLEEAWSLIERMPMEPDYGVWGALLNGCNLHSNVKLSEKVMENLIKLKANDPGNYVAVSSIYAQIGRWVDARKVRELMGNIEVNKAPGLSWS